MNLSSIFIKRPVMTTLVTAAIMIFGIIAYLKLPVSDLPNVDFPTIQVSASLPGASPETMASSVATPLERQFTTIAGLDSMTSTSNVGSTQITLQFNLERNIDAAAQDVQTAISRTLRQLPPDMPTPPSYNKVNPADQPIMYMALASDILPVSQLDEYGQIMMAQRISTIQGVAQVSVFGSQKFAVRIKVDPKELIARDIGIDEVAAAVDRNNVNSPTGTLYGDHKAYTIESSGQLYDAKSYLPLAVTYRNGAPVRLKEVGSTHDSVENDKTSAWYVTPDKATRSVVLAVQKQPGTNTVEICRSIAKLLPVFQAALPPSAELHIISDRSIPIHESVNEVQHTLLITIGLVILVIFLFLRNLRTTIIPALAVPLSLIGTAIVMYLLDYSLNNISLMALTLSVGFVVDDAVVMLENIVRHMERGESRMEAAFKGAREIGFTIISMTISLAAVFIPVLFMGGIIGRLYKEFAVTIGVAILISGFISLSLTPMLCSRFLPHSNREEQGWFNRLLEWPFTIAQKVYHRTLLWTFRIKALILLISIGLTIYAIHLYRVIPTGFMPPIDMSQIFGIAEAAQGISFSSLVEHQKRINQIIQKNENVEVFFSSAGGRGGITSSNTGIVFLRLKPKSERQLSVEGVIGELRGQLAQVPGVRVFMQNPPPIRLGGRLTKALYQFSLQSTESDTLYEFAPLMVDKLAQIPGFQDVSSDLQNSNPEVTIAIDRDKAASLGLTVEQIQNALYYAYGSRQISTIYTASNSYQVILEVEPEYQVDPSLLSLLYIRSGNGSLIPLDTVATLTNTLGPLTINHLGQLPAVTISFNLEPGFSLSDAVVQIEREARLLLPATISVMFQGSAEAFQASIGKMTILIIISILVIYMVLGILYESFIHPLTILTALPFAGLGALLTLIHFKYDLNLYGFVGLIMLIGIVKKNGIMMIDFALEAQRRQNMPPEQAIIEACIIRFRPIMMTTMAALLGALPLTLAQGVGSESREQLGLVVIGGLIFSQFLTLYVTPIFYVYMDKLSRFFKWIFVRSSPVAPPAVSAEPV